MGHDGLTRSPSGLSERRTGFSPPELGSPTAPVVPPTGAVPCPPPVRLARGRARSHGRRSGPGRVRAGGRSAAPRPRRPQAGSGTGVVHRSPRPAASAGPRDGRLVACQLTQPSSPSSVPPVASAPARSRSPSGAAWRRPGRRPSSSTSTCDRGGLEVTAGVEHLPGPAVGRPAGTSAVGSRPTCSCPRSPARAGATCCRPAAVRLPRCPSVRSSTSLDALAEGPARVVLDLPADEPAAAAACSGRGALVLVVLGLRTRALADADAAVSRLLDARTDRRAPPTCASSREVPDAGPDVRRRRRGPPRRRPPAPPPRRRRTCRATPSAASSPASAVTPCAAVPTPWSTAVDDAGGRLVTRPGPEDPIDPFGPAVERSIRAGAPPTPETIARMAAAHTATLGAEGRDGAATRAASSSSSGWARWRRLAADPAVTDVLVNGDGVGVGRPGARGRGRGDAGAGRRPAAPRRATRGRRGPTARRRPAVGRRRAPRRSAPPRRAPAARGRRAAPQPALRAAPPAGRRTPSWRSGPSTPAHGRRCCARSSPPGSRSS